MWQKEYTKEYFSLQAMNSGKAYCNHPLPWEGEGRLAACRKWVGLELLAPARDLECGIAAIRYGADAVYIGADRFGARAAAGNSVDDIARLCDYAHQFGAKVYVTVNTIIYENELDDTQRLITDLSRIGVDALLVQDMATLRMRRVAFGEVGRAPVLHASTQMDNRTVEKTRWLRSLGFTRAVLARELSLEEIRTIHKAVPDMELEVFVHGALCVSYSGQCYASQYLLGRSANRGECAQVCRMKFDLVDAEDKNVVKDRYLLSMKDLCQIDHLEELADAGATSFKIEGRLKGVEYVKNVVAAYSRKLDEIISRRQGDYCRASWGCPTLSPSLTPDLNKTFNRGYTNYFLNGRKGKLATWFTPKALGEFVGTVKEMCPRWFRVSPPSRGGVSQIVFSNGDGLCFLDGNHELVGFRVNRVEGGRLFPLRMPQGLKLGMSLYRNNDVAFEKTLKTDVTRRAIPVDMAFGTTGDGFRLTASFQTNDGQKVEASATMVFEHRKADKPQGNNMRKQLSKLGGTVYEARNITISDEAQSLFVPSSLLAQLRRDAINALAETAPRVCAGVTNNGVTEGIHGDMPLQVGYWSPEYRQYTYLYNVANSQARDFYATHGLDISQPAFEVSQPREGVVMQCRYCLRHELGFCVRHGGKQPTWKEPLTLRLGDGHQFRLEFRCDECQMNLHIT